MRAGPRALLRIVPAGALAGLAALALLAGCAGAGDGSARRAPGEPPELVILGIDGFDWTIVDPLLAAGRMPVTAGLVARGTRADLLTLLPLQKSPVIWTTIATGRLPEEGGRGFLIRTSEDGDGGPRAFTAWNRAHRAFWNILPAAGIRVAVLGWLETWPVERIDGVIVSDWVQYDIGERGKGARLEWRTWPTGLDETVERLVVHPDDVPDERLVPLVGGGWEAGEPPPAALATGIRDLRWILAGDLTFTAIGEEWLRNRPEPVVAIYLRGPDAVCHKFWGDREHLADGGGDPAQVAAFGETVDRYYEATDALIGRLVDAIDLDRTTLLVVSDHGFQGARRALDGSPMLGIWMHRELGTILVAGPWAAGAGVRAEAARVQDVLPTVLHGLGLPVGADLDGEPALDLLGPAGGADRPVETIPTWETGEPPDFPGGIDSPAAESVAEAIEERVRALGYVE